MDLSAETDENLMMRFGRGEAAAFEALYSRHEARVFRYLFRQLRDQAGADDVMQDVWFSVARNAQRYQPDAKFTTWLFTLAHNRMIDVIRKRRPQQSLDDVGESEDGSSLQDRLPADGRDEPERRTQSLQEADALLAAVAKLPADQRSAFLLQAEADLSLEDIAAATGTNFETVKSRLRYARAKLKQLLWEYA
jgi:RNA polymerase sigma factor (sigma-70 family)